METAHPLAEEAMKSPLAPRAGGGEAPKGVPQPERTHLPSWRRRFFAFVVMVFLTEAAVHYLTRFVAPDAQFARILIDALCVTLILSAVTWWGIVRPGKQIGSELSDTRVRAANESYRVLFEQTPNGIVLIDPKNGAALEFNDAACRQLGYTRDEFARLRLADIEAKETPERQVARVEKMLREGRDDFETLHRTKNGELRVVRVTGQAVAVAGEPALHYFFSDVTDQKRAEDELKRHRDQLEDLVSARTAELQEVVGRLQTEAAELWRAEETLRLQSVIATYMAEGVCLVRVADAMIVHANERFEQMLGYEPGELNGKPMHILNFEEPSRKAVEVTWAIFQQLVGTGEAVYEVQSVKKDGTPCWCRAHTTRFDHPLYGPVWLVVQADITDTRLIETELRISEEKYRGLYDSIQDGIVHWDMTGSILQCNRAYRDMLGYSDEELKKLTYAQITPAKWHEMEDQIVRDLILARGYSDEYEKEYLRKDGTVVPITLRVWLIKNAQGESTGMWGIVRDITERKRTEEALATLNREIFQRTVDLEAANHELEAFSYSVSHDLKAPLRAIDGFARILGEGYGDRLDDEGRRVLAVVRDSAKDMGQLVNDLLTFSRLGRKDLKMTRLDMGGLVREVFGSLEANLGGRTIRRDVGPLPEACGDPATIREVLVNLLSNAVKFTRPRAQALIEMKGSVEGEEAVFSIKDNGVGFDMAYQDKLFCVFQRLHGAAEFEGTGIGLALVKRIIQRHGGRVWAEGKVDTGATFHFTLPRHGPS